MNDFETILLWLSPVFVFVFVWAMISIAVDSNKHHNKIMERLDAEFKARGFRDRRKAARESARHVL